MDALRGSEEPVARFLRDSEVAGKTKGWQGSAASFLGYLVAHEAHHRGLAMVAMRLSGRKLTQEVVYGQWDWGKKKKSKG